jgi:hypothetical protein
MFDDDDDDEEQFSVATDTTEEFSMLTTVHHLILNIEQQFDSNIIAEKKKVSKFVVLVKGEKHVVVVGLPVGMCAVFSGGMIGGNELSINDQHGPSRTAPPRSLACESVETF